jgi:hypothetical protein
LKELATATNGQAISLGRSSALVVKVRADCMEQMTCPSRLNQRSQTLTRLERQFTPIYHRNHSLWESCIASALSPTYGGHTLRIFMEDMWKLTARSGEIQALQTPFLLLSFPKHSSSSHPISGPCDPHSPHIHSPLAHIY